MGKSSVVSESVVAPLKRRRWTVQEKRRIVEETLAPGASIARIARDNDVNADQGTKGTKGTKGTA